MFIYNFILRQEIEPFQQNEAFICYQTEQLFCFGSSDCVLFKFEIYFLQNCVANLPLTYYDIVIDCILDD